MMACVEKREPFLFYTHSCTYSSTIKKVLTTFPSNQHRQKKVSLEKDGGLFKPYHCFQFFLDFLCSLPSPSGCVGKEVADNALC